MRGLELHIGGAPATISVKNVSEALATLDELLHQLDTSLGAVSFSNLQMGSVTTTLDIDDSLAETVTAGLESVGTPKLPSSWSAQALATAAKLGKVLIHAGNGTSRIGSQGRSVDITEPLIARLTKASEAAANQGLVLTTASGVLYAYSNKNPDDDEIRGRLLTPADRMIHLILPQSLREKALALIDHDVTVMGPAQLRENHVHSIFVESLSEAHPPLRNRAATRGVPEWAKFLPAGDSVELVRQMRDE